jgi:hypothetical protein
MGVQVMCAGGLPSVSSGIGAGERLLKSGIFWSFTAMRAEHTAIPCQGFGASAPVNTTLSFK